MRFHLPLLCVAVGVFAQSNSTITGQVTDPSGAAIPGATVTVRSEETGVRMVLQTNAEGYYTAPNLAPVTYTVTAEFAGFQSMASKAFKIDTTTTARIDLKLQPENSRQVVEVTGEPPAIETQTGMVGTTVSNREIQNLPLDGRNTLTLALTLPGVGGEVGTDEGGIFQNVPASGAGLSISGGRPSSSAFMVDGANSTSIGIGRSAANFSPDTVQELRVITSSFSAQYGTTGGGVVSTVIKSGTNRFNGNVFWFHRNPALGARQFNRPIDPQFRRHELGFTAGGPIKRDKTFFFVANELKRYADAVDNYWRVPTVEERAGNFVNMYVQPGQTRPLLYRQFDCRDASCSQLFPINRATTAPYPLFNDSDPDPARQGRVIPRQFIDPLALKILEDVPLPNMPYNADGNNYFGVRGVQGRDNRWNAKIDHVLNAHHRLSGRYTHVPTFSDRYQVSKGNLFFALPSDQGFTRQIGLTLSSQSSRNIINEARASYLYFDSSRTPPGDLATKNYTIDKFGLPSTTTFGYPGFNAGWGVYGINTGNNLGIYREHQYQASDDLTIIRGRHTYTIGFDMRILQMNTKVSGLREACCAQYAFNANQSNAGLTTIAGGAGGLAFASFLLGVPNTIGLRDIVVPYYYRFNASSAYFQDDWKVSKRLTLNLGLRWQYNSPRSEKYNRQASIDLEKPVAIRNASGGIDGYTVNYLYTGINGASNYLEPTHKRNFAPRFGFAWRVRDRSVIRGGYGISFAPSTGTGRNPVPDFGLGGTTAYNNVRWTGNAAAPLTQSKVPQAAISLGRNVPVLINTANLLEIPSSGVLCAGCAPADPRVPSGSLVAFAKQNRSPYIQTWNVTVETELPNQFTFTMSYLGQKGTHLNLPPLPFNNPDPTQFDALLDAGLDPDESVPDPFGRVDAAGNLRNVRRVDLTRPYPTIGDINLFRLSGANSFYNAGTFEIRRRPRSKGIDFRFNYSWSKSIDNASEANMDGEQLFSWTNGRAQNPFDLTNNRSVSMWDQRHRFNGTMSYYLPFRRNLLLKDWVMSSIGSIVSGVPFAPTLNFGNGVPSGQTTWTRIRPDIVPGVPLINPDWNKSNANDVPYFNPRAFAIPGYGQLGSSPRALDYARNPWRQTLNASVMREFRPFQNERRYVQFRAEFFNVLNHVVFNTNNNSSPGIFTSAPPVTRTGLSLAGPLPYLNGLAAGAFPTGSRENLIAATYNQNFGKLLRDNNGPGRIVQLAIKLYW